MQKMRRKSFFETRFELLGWEIGKNDGQKNSSAYLPDLPSPPGHEIENGEIKTSIFSQGATWDDFAKKCSRASSFLGGRKTTYKYADLK